MHEYFVYSALDYSHNTEKATNILDGIQFSLCEQNVICMSTDVHIYVCLYIKLGQAGTTNETENNVQCGKVKKKNRVKIKRRNKVVSNKSTIHTTYIIV